MALPLDPFYPILPNAQWVQRLVPLGVKTVQLRIKDLTGQALLREIVAAQQACTAHDCLLIVNDHWREAIECGCHAVHLGQEDIQGADRESIATAGMLLGVSTHDENELRRALQFDPDYIALGPIFGTRSKELEWSNQGLDRIRQWRELVADRLLVAIGGITLELAADVFHAGADSVAVIGDVTGAPDPSDRTRRWLSTTAALRA